MPLIPRNSLLDLYKKDLLKEKKSKAHVGERKSSYILGRRNGACNFSDVAIGKQCVECRKAAYQQERKEWAAAGDKDP